MKYDTLYQNRKDRFSLRKIRKGGVGLAGVLLGSLLFGLAVVNQPTTVHAAEAGTTQEGNKQENIDNKVNDVNQSTNTQQQNSNELKSNQTEQKVVAKSTDNNKQSINSDEQKCGTIQRWITDNLSGKPRQATQAQSLTYYKDKDGNYTTNGKGFPEYDPEAGYKVQISRAGYVDVVSAGAIIPAENPTSDQIKNWGTGYNHWYHINYLGSCKVNQYVNKSLTRTVTIKAPKGYEKDNKEITQTVSFKRYATIKAGKIVQWITPYTVTSSSDSFAEVDAPTIPGYTASVKNAPEIDKVTADQTVSNVTITYTKDLSKTDQSTTPAQTTNAQPTKPITPAQPTSSGKTDQPTQPAQPTAPATSDNSNNSSSTSTQLNSSVPENTNSSDNNVATTHTNSSVTTNNNSSATTQTQPNTSTVSNTNNDQTSNISSVSTKVTKQAVKKLILTHNAFVYTKNGRLSKKNGRVITWKRGRNVSASSKIVMIGSKKYYKVGKNAYIKISNTVGKKLRAFRLTRKAKVYKLSRGKMVAIKNASLKKGSVVKALYNGNGIKNHGAFYYYIGKNRYIKAGNTISKK